MQVEPLAFSEVQDDYLSVFAFLYFWFGWFHSHGQEKMGGYGGELKSLKLNK